MRSPPTLHQPWQWAGEAGTHRRQVGIHSRLLQWVAILRLRPPATPRHKEGEGIPHRVEATRHRPSRKVVAMRREWWGAVWCLCSRGVMDVMSFWLHCEFVIVRLLVTVAG